MSFLALINTIKEIIVLFLLTTVLRTIFFFLEIPNFLSNKECDHIIRLAESKQFISSVARGGLQSMSDFEIPEIRSKNQLYLFALLLEGSGLDLGIIALPLV